MARLKKLGPVTETTAEGMEVSVASEDQKQLQDLLTWIWLCSNDIMRGHTNESPEEDNVEALGAKILHLLKAGRREEPSGPSGSVTVAFGTPPPSSRGWETSYQQVDPPSRSGRG